jgi:hypothetical protein
VSKVTIVYRRKDDKKDKEVEFAGNIAYALAQGMTFIDMNQPISVIAVRKEI